MQALSQGAAIPVSLLPAASRAAALLQDHHGSAVPATIARQLGNMPGDDVVFGPRFPTWACSACSRGSTNWASRVICACGKRSPDRIRAAAIRNAYPPGEVADKGGAKGGAAHPKLRQHNEGKSPRGGKRVGDGPPWSEIHILSEKIKKLEELERRQEQKSLKPPPTVPGSADRDLEEESAENLRSQIVELEGTAKSSTNEFIRKLAKEQIEELKAKLQDRKTPEDRQAAALWKLKKAKQKRTRVLEQLLESKETLQAAQRGHLELEARAKAVDAEVALLETLLAEASAATLPVQATHTETVIPDEVLAHAELGAEIKEMLASPAYASLLRLRGDIAKKEVAPSPMSNGTGSVTSADGTQDVLFKDSVADSWCDFGGDPSFFSEDAFNQFKSVSTREEFTDMAHKMGFGCKRPRFAKAEPY